MSFVTTPTRRSAPRRPQRSAISELLPVPTGPPTPTRIARPACSRSAGKEPPALGGVIERARVDQRRAGTRQLARHRRDGRELLEDGGQRGDPAGGGARVDREQLDGGGGDRRSV